MTMNKLLIWDIFCVILIYILARKFESIKINTKTPTFHIGRMIIQNHWLLIIIARVEEKIARIFDRVHYVLSVIKWEIK